MYAFTLGLQLDENQTGFQGISYPTIGPNRLVQVLEQCLGLSLPPDDVDHLRLAAYRAALEKGLAQMSNPFYRQSFQSDQIGAAAALLERRDELIQSGWSFTQSEEMPSRLQVFAVLEPFFQQAIQQYDRTLLGMADRLNLLVRTLPDRLNPIQALQMMEPRTLWPMGWQRLFERLEAQGTQVTALDTELDKPERSDLDTFRQVAWGQNQSSSIQPLQADGSLLVLQGNSDAELSPVLARLLAENPTFKPALLVPEEQSQLESYLLLEGLPAIGLSKTSPARPGQQVLKLIPAFIWEPVDPAQILEFLTLSEKPLDAILSSELAIALGKSPGLNSREWNLRVARFFAGSDHQSTRKEDLERVRKEYRLWFDRQRYPEQEPAPIEAILPMFEHLSRWAQHQVEQEESSPILQALRGQAQRMEELLQAHPRPQISRLELEQLIRAVYEGTPVVRHPAEANAYITYTANGAIPFPIPHLIWWSFIDREADPFFSRWYRAERHYLEQQEIRLQHPELESQLLLFQQKWPLTRVREQLILVLPSTLAGTEVNPHPVFAMLKAAFEDLSGITLSWGSSAPPPEAWQRRFDIPATQETYCDAIPPPPDFLHLNNPDQLPRKQTSSFTALQALLYYPYQWLFRDQLELKASAMVSIPEEQTLKGNLSHRIFEILLEDENALTYSRAELFERIELLAHQIFHQEGATLLLYGKEPDRIRFINEVQHAAWSFVHTIRQSEWQIRGIEENLSGPFADLTLTGRADVVMKRKEELAVVDLKWGGKTYRKELIQNNKDLQLVLYGKLIAPDQWPQTAYFIIRSSEWLTRGSNMLEGVEPVSTSSDIETVQQEIWDAMQRTFYWRQEQLKQGQIEIRCANNLERLEEHYGAILTELLELPDKDAPFDPYRTLIRQYQ